MTWGANVQITDADSPIVLDPNLATCYHGDYDTQTQTASAAVIVWSDDRATEGGGNNPDVWTDTIALSTDFLVLPSPAAQEVCAPANAVVNVSVPSFNAFALPVTLSTSGVPAGATVNFSVNPVTPGGTSVLTLGNTGAVAPGTSTVTITGTAAGPITHTGDTVVTIASGNPAAASLTAPANGASNVPALPTFTWSAVAGASSYSIQVSTNAGFTNIVASATGVGDPTWTSNVALNTSTQHFWRVQATNACGTGIDSAVFNFTTVAAPGDCGPGTLAEIDYQYGFEAGAGGWTHSGTGDSWAIVATNPHSGTSQYHAGDPAVVSDQRLVSPAVVLPTGQNPLVLKFWHVPNLEPSGATACFDGGILEVSTNGGGTWTQVLAADLLVGPYKGVVSSSFSNPLAGLDAWCGDSAYFQTVADISAYAGQSAQFRLRLGSDNSVTACGLGRRRRGRPVLRLTTRCRSSTVSRATTCRRGAWPFPDPFGVRIAGNSPASFPAPASSSRVPGPTALPSREGRRRKIGRELETESAQRALGDLAGWKRLGLGDRRFESGARGGAIAAIRLDLGAGTEDSEAARAVGLRQGAVGGGERATGVLHRRDRPRRGAPAGCSRRVDRAPRPRASGWRAAARRSRDRPRGDGSRRRRGRPEWAPWPRRSRGARSTRRPGASCRPRPWRPRGRR